MREFTSKERKKAFDMVFKDKIVPVFNSNGFVRHTKTSKRLYKDLGNKLCVFIFFEYKSRFECYEITIAYFDEEIGNVYDDNYLAMVNGRNPSLSIDNIAELDYLVDNWIAEIEYSVFPFIHDHSDHKSILESSRFNISKAREEKVLALLNEKSIQE